MPSLRSWTTGQQSNDDPLPVTGQGPKKVPVNERARGAAGIYGASRSEVGNGGGSGWGRGAETLQKQSVKQSERKVLRWPTI
jgi:hypothetical protein